MWLSWGHCLRGTHFYFPLQVHKKGGGKEALIEGFWAWGPDVVKYNFRTASSLDVNDQ
jgi:hypothetical protein